MNRDRYSRGWPNGWKTCGDCGQPHNPNDPPCTHDRLAVMDVIRLGGVFGTRYDVMQEFQAKSDNVRNALGEGILDQDEVQAMIDRFREECDDKLVALPVKEGVTP